MPTHIFLMSCLNLVLNHLLSFSRFGVRPDSIFGMYIRHCVVTFEEMFYEHLSRLAAEVAHYVREYEQQKTNLIFEAAAPSSTWGCRKEGPVLEKFLNNQVSKVDRGVELESDAVHKMEELQGLEAEQPKLLLWQHELAVKRRDYLAAMETLLR